MKLRSSQACTTFANRSVNSQSPTSVPYETLALVLKLCHRTIVALVLSAAVGLVAVGLCLVALTGCGSGSGAPTHKPPPVIGGKKAPVSLTAPLAYIADALSRHEVGICTGTLVASRLILTAGHCVENPVTGKLRFPTGFRLTVRGTHHGLKKGRILRASRVIAYPGFRRGSERPDAGLIVLTHPVGGPVQVTASGTDVAQVHGGVPVTLVGWVPYHRNGLVIRSSDEANTELQRSSVCSSDDEAFFHAAIDYCVLDPPSYKSGVCNGDSGGPLLIHTVTGAAVEIGIASEAFGHCSTRLPSIFTRVSAIAPWLEMWVKRYG